MAWGLKRYIKNAMLTTACTALIVHGNGCTDGYRVVPTVNNYPVPMGEFGSQGDGGQNYFKSNDKKWWLKYVLIAGGIVGGILLANEINDGDGGGGGGEGGGGTKDPAGKSPENPPKD